MPDRRAIVNPVKGKKPPDTGTMAIIAATEVDLRMLARLTDTPVVEQRKLYMSTLQVHADDQRRFTLAGPIVGAPYAAMIVESLWVWGVKTILFIGWCGAVSRESKPGTSSCRKTPWSTRARPATIATRHAMWPCPPGTGASGPPGPAAPWGIRFHEGAVWTTDAIFPGNR
jgi:hypothetical protein